MKVAVFGGPVQFGATVGIVARIKHTADRPVRVTGTRVATHGDRITGRALVAPVPTWCATTAHAGGCAAVGYV
jgi:hypothetical protein